MKKFIVERKLPGAGNLSEADLMLLASKSVLVIQSLGKQYHWIQTFVTANKLYCIHVAEDAETVRQHAREGGFPIDNIEEVKTVIDPTTGRF